MRSVGTAYTMYFNIKNQRAGNLFVKPFRSRHIGDDRYLQKVVQYTHLNPVELFEPGWKNGNVRFQSALSKKISEYRYSSLGAYQGKPFAERAVLDEESVDMIADGMPPLEELIDDSIEYYRELTL